MIGGDDDGDDDDDGGDGNDNEDGSGLFALAGKSSVVR